MSDIDKEKILEIGKKIGYAVGMNCTDEEIELFNKFLEDYKYKDKELETFKKIAEKLARFSCRIANYDSSELEQKTKETLDWARKEVENEN